MPSQEGDQVGKAELYRAEIRRMYWTMQRRVPCRHDSLLRPQADVSGQVVVHDVAVLLLLQCWEQKIGQEEVEDGLVAVTRE